MLRRNLQPRFRQCRDVLFDQLGCHREQPVGFGICRHHQIILCGGFLDLLFEFEVLVLAVDLDGKPRRLCRISDRVLPSLDLGLQECLEFVPLVVDGGLENRERFGDQRQVVVREEEVGVGGNLWRPV